MLFAKLVQFVRIQLNSRQSQVVRAHLGELLVESFCLFAQGVVFLSLASEGTVLHHE